MYIRISAQQHFLRFKTPFRIAHGVREGTNVVIVKAEYDGKMGFGEASLPPYLPATVDSTLNLLSDKLLSQIAFPFDIPSITQQLGERFEGEMPAKAALEMALWNLKSQCEGRLIAEILNIGSSGNKTPHFYTIGIGSKSEMKDKIADGLSFGFDHFKLKLNGENDIDIIKNFRELTDAAFAVDVNQGWKELQEACTVSDFLEKSGCLLLEQPFDKADRIMSKHLKENYTMPVIADEACQLPQDLPDLEESFDGVNIKLQKCGGMTNALKMIHTAKAMNMKLLIGCMSESSIGCGVAEELTPLCDWADLDGPFLTVDIPNPDELFS